MVGWRIHHGDKMKKQHKKLVLAREIVRSLSQDQMSFANGGLKIDPTSPPPPGTIDGCQVSGADVCHSGQSGCNSCLNQSC